MTTLPQNPSPACSCLSQGGGRLAEGPPLTLEFAPSVACNRACREFPCGSARAADGVSRIALGEFARADDVHVVSLARAQVILECAAAAGCRSVVWTGGEPTVTPELPAMIAHSAKLGMANSLYTNGVLIGSHSRLAPQLLAPRNHLLFVRLSLDALSPQIAARFSGASPEHVTRQLAGLDALLAARAAFANPYRACAVTPPEVTVRIVVDATNLPDLPLLCECVASVYSHYHRFRQAGDSFVVRPLLRHRGSEGPPAIPDDTVIREIIRLCGRRGAGTPGLEAAGLQVRLGFGLDRLERGEVASYVALLAEAGAEREVCRTDLGQQDDGACNRRSGFARYCATAD